MDQWSQNWALLFLPTWSLLSHAHMHTYTHVSSSGRDDRLGKNKKTGKVEWSKWTRMLLDTQHFIRHPASYKPFILELILELMSTALLSTPIPNVHTYTHTRTLTTAEVFNPELSHVGTLMRHNRNNHKSNVTRRSWWLQRGAFSKSLSISAVIVRQKRGEDCDFYNGDTCKVSLVPDAESFGLLDVEEGRFNLWFVAFAVWGGEPTAVNVWVLLLKLKQTQETYDWVTAFSHPRPWGSE